MTTEEAFGWVCLVDFQHEIGHASGGNVIYPSREELERERRCCRGGGEQFCKPVRVRLTLAEEDE